MTDLMAKDLGLAVNAARELRQPLFVAPVALEVYRLASSHGLRAKGFLLGLYLPQTLPTRSSCLRLRRETQGAADVTAP